MTLTDACRAHDRDDLRTRSIIGAFYAVYNKLGYGFLEAPYVRALAMELRKRGHFVQREYLVEIFYDGERIGWYRTDMLVDRQIAVEVKSGERLTPIGRRQLLNCLCASTLRTGLRLHFGPEARVIRVAVPCEGPPRTLGAPGVSLRDIPEL